jgi:hypothetical protein
MEQGEHDHLMKRRIRKLWLRAKLPISVAEATAVFEFFPLQLMDE